MHDFDDTVGPSPVSMANLVLFVLFVWVFCLGPPVPCFASLLFLFGETQIWPGDLRVVGFGALWCCFCLMICLFLMKPRRFMLNFLICLLAYPNVRTEPQSEIGHNRGKKKGHPCWLAFRGELSTVAVWQQ